MIGDNITALAAFTAGLLTFFAPCTFVTLPTFISYIISRATGEDTLDVKGKNYRLKIFFSALSYVSGFILVFTSLGLLATQAGMYLFQNREMFTRVGSILIIFFGLFLLVGEKWKILQFMFIERKIRVKDDNKKTKGYLFPLVLGITSALSWTPCVGPILGGILFLAGSRADTIFQGGFLLFLYSLGISIPFMIIAMGIGYTEKWIKKFSKYSIWIHRVSAMFLILMGIALLTGFSSQIFGFFYKIFTSFGYTPV